MGIPTVHRTELRGLEKIHAGKVRDIYAVDAEHLLIVTTDRLSAFDVVLPDPIPGKGRVLNQISNFWFARTRHIVPNHLSGKTIDSIIVDPAERALPRRLIRRPPAVSTGHAFVHGSAGGPCDDVRRRQRLGDAGHAAPGTHPPSS